MSTREHETFLASWEHETQSTLKLLRALPETQYDFRPDAGARSIGEMAWHLAEIDAYIGLGAAAGNIDFSVKLPGLERPKTIAALAPAFEKVHADCVAKVRAMGADRMDQMMPFMGRTMRTGDVLWNVLLHHMIHHRGQLSLMCRLAGGTAPGLYGPNREDMAAMQRS